MERHKKWNFSVQSAYHIQQELSASLAAGSSYEIGTKTIWKALWALQVSNAKKFFFMASLP